MFVELPEFGTVKEAINWGIFIRLKRSVLAKQLNSNQNSASGELYGSHVFLFFSFFFHGKEDSGYIISYQLFNFQSCFPTHEFGCLRISPQYIFLFGVWSYFLPSQCLLKIVLMLFWILKPSITYYPRLAFLRIFENPVLLTCFWNLAVWLYDSKLYKLT